MDIDLDPWDPGGPPDEWITGLTRATEWLISLPAHIRGTMLKLMDLAIRGQEVDLKREDLKLRQGEALQAARQYTLDRRRLNWSKPTTVAAVVVALVSLASVPHMIGLKMPDLSHLTAVSSPSPAVSTPSTVVSHAVTLQRGASAKGHRGCWTSGCSYMVISGSGFAPSSTVTITCDYGIAHIIDRYHAKTDKNGNLTTTECYVGFSHQDVWATINGVQSNTVRW